MADRPKKWDRCLYCDASIKGDDATVASLHDPYCPHGKALKRAEDSHKSAVVIDRARLDIARLDIAEQLSTAVLKLSAASNVLAAYGVPEDRQRGVANAVEVLASRLRKENMALEAAANDLSSRLDAADERLALTVNRLLDQENKTHDERQARILAESRLSSFREHSIQRGVSGCSCKICMGAWSHTREGELHEPWCPNAAFAVETSLQNSKETEHGS
jgi:hypothetical protein